MKFENYEEYYRFFKRLINIERNEEMSKQREEMMKLSGEERERRGRCILHLRGRDAGRGIGGAYLVRFIRKNMPDTEISLGDVVLISVGKPRKDNPSGTVMERRKSSITVAFNGKPQKFVYGRDLRMDLYVNDITFQRMLDALKKIKNSRFLPLLIGKIYPRFESVRNIDIHNKNLNFSQREAVLKSLSSKDIFIIHGPPGTGKTTTIAEAIYQEVKRGKKVIATADSNIAVDNILEKLIGYDISVLRVGNPARVIKTLMEHTLDYVLETMPEYREARKIWDRIDILKGERDKNIKPEMKWRRGLSDDEIKYLSSANRSVRGIQIGVIKSMAKWLDINDEITKLVEKAKKYEDRAIKRLIDGADVICTTNSTAGGEILAGYNFDTLFIDEATQAVEPSCLIPMVKVNKIVMAGDHKQLPPTVASIDAKGLEYTLFERLLSIYGDKIIHVLNVQYRMNEKIMKFPNMVFYGNEIFTAEDVKNITLSDFPLKFKNGEDIITRACNPDLPVVFIDTIGQCPEKTKTGSTSKMNQCEGSIVMKLAEQLISMGLKKDYIGVITPYDDQVDYLRMNLCGFEIKSVDGYQGREKEVIIISFVRSNKNGELGFLNDLRRLNVSLTRAKRKLIMIGDSLTLSTNKTYEMLINHVREIDGYFKI